MSISWLIGIGVMGLLLSFLLAGAETAFFRLTERDVRVLARRKARLGRWLRQLRERRDEVLAVLDGGQLMALVFWIGSTLGLVLGHGWPVGQTLGVAFLIGVTMGEFVPRALAMRSPAGWMRWYAPVVIGLMTVSGWAVQPLLNKVQKWMSQWVQGRGAGFAQVTEEDYRELVEMAAEVRAIDQEEKTMILEIMDLDRREAHEAMRPRSEMKMLPDDLPIEAMRREARRVRHRRIPLYDKDADTVVGVLDAWKLLLEEGEDLEAFIEFPSFVPETMTLAPLLRSLQAQKRGMAIVVDEFGTVSGLITAWDVLEDIVRRRPAELEKPSIKGGSSRKAWVVPGTMHLDELEDRGIFLPDVRGVDTVAGFLLYWTGRILRVGEEVQVGALRFRVMDADERRIKQVQIEVGRSRTGRGGREG